MWNKIISFFYALMFHVLLLVLLFFNVEWPFKPHLISSPAPDEQIIQAVAMDEKQMLATVKEWQNQQTVDNKSKKKQYIELENNITKLERTVTKETQQLDKLRQQKAKEQQRLAELKKQRETKSEALAKLKRQQIEQARLKQQAEETRKREETLRKALEKAERERQQQLEKERQARQQAEAKRLAEEKQRQAQEAEKKRQAAEQQARLAKEAEEKRRAAEQQAKREAEEKRKAAEQAAAKQAENEKKQRIEQTMLKIQRKVQQHWIRPPGNYRGLSCIIEILLNPNGSVSQVTVVQGSGNIAFDNSAKRAVHQASPLSIPKDLFEVFRHFQFKFTP